MTDQPTGRGDRSAEPGGSALSRLHRPDLSVSAVVLIICGLLFARTFAFDSVPASLAQNVQPTTFPRLVLLVIMAIALILPFEYRQKWHAGIDLDSDRRERIPPIVFLTGAALLVFVGVMPWLGTFAGLLMTAALLPLLWGERRWKILVPYVVIFPTGVMWFFSEVLRVTFLPGIVGHIFW